jgi:hypothetical protein
MGIWNSDRFNERRERFMRIRTLTMRVLALVVGASAVFAAANLHPLEARAAIHAKKVKGGLNGPAAFTFSKKGLIYYLERGSGEVRILNPSTGSTRLFFDISGVNGQGERGALGIALHPRFPAKPFVYVYVTRRSGGVVSTIVSVPGSTLNGVRLRLSIMATEAYIRRSRAVKSFSTDYSQRNIFADSVVKARNITASTATSPR